MTNKCTYLPGEDVLPLHSLLYEEYLLLDELNRVRINGKLISADLKEQVIENLFKQRKHVTTKAFIDWLKKNSVVFHAHKDLEISGLHAEDGFACSLRSYIDFSTHGFDINDSTIPMIEELIKWSTIFENRSILREKIVTAYPALTETQVNYVCRRRYTGWGRLSKKLLDGIQGDNQAENSTIIDMMRVTKSNFMQVINNKEYGFDRAIEAEQGVSNSDSISLQEVQALQGSPALKRGIWQSVRIL